MSSEPLQFPARENTGLRPHGMGYRYTNTEHQIVMEFSYLHGGDEPSAEIVVSTTLPGTPGHLTLQRIRLNGATSKKGLVTTLMPLAPSVPWSDLVEIACTGVIYAMRKGTRIEIGAEFVGDIAPTWLVDQLIMERKLNALFGPGGSGKGYLSLAMAVAVQSGKPFAGYATQQTNVLYLDWEDDKQEFDQRVTAICRGWSLPFVAMRYRRCANPLRHNVEFLSRYCQDEGIGLLVCDSFTGAAGSSSEHATYEQSAMSLIEAARQIGTTVLFIDHVVGEGVTKRKDGLVGKQYGSIMKQNQIRNNMEVKKDQEYGVAWDVGVYPGKVNIGAPRRPMGFHLDFGATENAVRITRSDVRESEVLSAPLSLSYKITGALRSGPLTYSHLFTLFQEEKNDTIRKTVRRMVERGQLVALPEGRFGLSHRATG
jgi:hypothetical protein